MRISDWSSDVCSSDLQLGENPAEIDLPVAQRAEAAGAIDPVLKPAIDPRTSGGVEFGVLDVEHADPLVINVDELQIVERLQHIMAGIIEDVGARMIVDAREEAFEGHPVVQILAGMNLIGEVDPLFVERSEEHTSDLQSLMRISYAVFCL